MKQIDYSTTTPQATDVILDVTFQVLASKHTPVVVCVGEKNGTAKFTNMVAELLIKQHAVNAYVYGRTANPITAKNLESAVAFVKERHISSKVFVVFAKTSQYQQLPILYYGKGKALIGNTSFGDYCFTAVLNNRPVMLGVEMQNQFKLASLVAEAIHLGISYASAINNYVAQK